MRRLAFFIALIASLHSLSAHTYKEAPELEKFFNDQGVKGTFALLDIAIDTITVSNEARAKERFIPASTLKIANSLIGLDVGAVKDVEEVLPYGGKPQRFKAWERDMSLREAIKASNVALGDEALKRAQRDYTFFASEDLYGLTSIDPATN